MILGKSHTMTRRQAMTACGLFASMLLLPLLGCGSSNGDGGGTDGGDTTRKVAVSGTVVDYLTGLGIPGYAVSFNGANATTNSEGVFSVKATPTTASSNMTLAGPPKADGTAQYYATVLYGDPAKTYSGTSGIPLNATGTVATEVPVGKITVGNVDTTPPFPPTL